MSMVPIPRPETSISVLPRVGLCDLYAALIADAKCPNTQRARVDDVAVFSRFLRTSPAQACAVFVSQGRGTANAIATAFRTAEQVRGLSSASINRRLSCLRRVVRLALRFDLIAWGGLDFDKLPDVASRDTRGPSRAEWDLLWGFLTKLGDNPTARRGRAIVRLMHDSALRKSEVIGLDLADLDLAGDRVNIVAKGAGQSKTWITISPLCTKLLREYLQARGYGPGPALFVSKVNNDAIIAAKLTADITELCAAGLSLRKVADVLNGSGRSTWTGAAWCEQSVWRHIHDSAPDKLQPFPGKTCQCVA